MEPEPVRMRYFFSLAALIIIVCCAHAQSKTDSLLNKLNETLEHKEEFVQARLQRIQDYKARVGRTSERFDIYYRIYQEYRTLIYDSAFTYARKLQIEAYRQKDPVKIAYAKVKLGFVLLSFEKTWIAYRQMNFLGSVVSPFFCV